SENSASHLGRDRDAHPHRHRRDGTEAGRPATEGRLRAHLVVEALGSCSGGTGRALLVRELQHLRDVEPPPPRVPRSICVWQEKPSGTTIVSRPSSRTLGSRPCSPHWSEIS